MSSCTFVIIKGGVGKYVTGHYRWIEGLLSGVNDPDEFNKMSMYCDRTSRNCWPNEFTDTGFLPAVIINFDKKILTSTDYNWLDDFEKYLKKGWKYKEFKAIGV